MEDLIKALQIFATYTQTRHPTHCEHDVLYIMDVSRGEMSTEDIQAVEKLGFLWDEIEECWMSFRFGSA